MIPQTRYAVTEDGAHIAYQVIGSGPVDIVFVHSFVSHVEIFWELPSFDQFIRELSAGARVIIFDKRGVGLSDRLSSNPDARGAHGRSALRSATARERRSPPCLRRRTPTGRWASSCGAEVCGWPGPPTTRGACARGCSRSGWQSGPSCGATRTGRRRLRA